MKRVGVLVKTRCRCLDGAGPTPRIEGVPYKCGLCDGRGYRLDEPPGFAADRTRQAGIRVDDLEITDTPGYWVRREPCPGGEGCLHAFRAGLGPCEGGVSLNVSFVEWQVRGPDGRFESPHRAWRALHRASRGIESSRRTR